MAASRSGDRDLGFAGMIAAGMTPEDAYAEIRRDLHAGGGIEIIRYLQGTEHGRAALECAAQDWARHGFAPPWEQPAGD